MNLKRPCGLWLLLMLVAAPGRAEQGNQRDPFRPAANTPPAARSPVKGMVGDGRGWHFWTTDEEGRWRRREPASAGDQPPEETGDPPGY